MQLTVLTDRAQGGSSLKDGELELMVSYATPHHLPLNCTHSNALISLQVNSHTV